MAENGVRFVAGQWNAVCDVCAQKYKSSEMRKRWDGLMVCPRDWEPRHPQDFLRSVPDHQAVPWSRPETPDVFVPSNWDKYINENISVYEAMTYFSNYVRYIPFMDVSQTLPPTMRPLNTFALNGSLLGGADSAQPLTQETVTMTDSIAVTPTKALSDSTSLSETLMAITASAINDDVGNSEYLSVTFLFTQAPLNGNALNGGPL